MRDSEERTRERRRKGEGKRRREGISEGKGKSCQRRFRAQACSSVHFISSFRSCFRPLGGFFHFCNIWDCHEGVLFRKKSGKTTPDLLNWSFKSRFHQYQREILQLSISSFSHANLLILLRHDPSFKTSGVISKFFSAIQVQLYDRFPFFFCSLHFVFLICCLSPFLLL